MVRKKPDSSRRPKLTSKDYKRASIGFAKRIYGENTAEYRIQQQIKKESDLMKKAGW